MIAGRAALLVALLALPGGPAAAEILLAEVSAAWGLDFRHRHGGSGRRYMVETVVGGVVLFDYDRDGDVDVFYVDGGPLPGYEGVLPRSRLLRNEGGRRFVDVTEGAGIRPSGYGAGATSGDVDGDGNPDLYVTAFGPNRLLRNRGDGTFVDVTEQAGVGDPAWSASAAFADVDRDGDLDLYVANYVDFTIETHRFCGSRERNLQGYCHPGAYEGAPDRFYRNRGDGTFEDATREAGFAGADEAGLGVVFADFDDDGWPDLYVANDADPNFFFRNRGDGTFEDVSLLSGTAYSDRGRPEGGMGVDAGDVNEDGLLDLFVTNFEFETNALYRNLGGGLFVDGRHAAELAEPSLVHLAFGTALADLDHDGDLDVLVANGHILDNAAEFDERSRYAQPNQLFENLGRGRFQEVAAAALETARVSRGLAVGDLDGDGDLDAVVVNSNDWSEVYENRGGAGERGWVLVDLAGSSGNRSGVGARVAVETAVGRQVREVKTASSYLSQNSMTLHFGVGQAPRIDRLTVRWPGGGGRRFAALPVDRRLLIPE